MAQEGEYVRRSVKDLAAGLNHGEVGRVPITSKPAKPLPNVKPKFHRASTANVPPGPATGHDVTGNLPAGEATNDAPGPRLPPRRGETPANDASMPMLPPRRPTENGAVRPPAPGLPVRQSEVQPSLPERRPSQASVISSISVSTDKPTLPGRRTSQSSIASSVSALSTKSGMTNGRSVSSRAPSFGDNRVKAPAYDPSTLPALPPKRTEQQKEKDKLAPLLPVRGKSASPVSPSAPKLPSRSDGALPAPPPRKLPPRDVPSLPTARRPASTNPAVSDAPGPTPPPIPLASRPDLSKIMATKPKFDPSATAAPTASASTSTVNCLVCRDWSGPDNHATRFPRQNVQSIERLAYDLTSPFQTLADKARAIFTWMHHNIAYDCDAFFGNCVRGMTPLETLRKGAGVCAGYADLYADLALKAGLECVVVGGHGKGFGYSDLKPGDPIPPEAQGHAWNAIKIDIGGPAGYGRPYWKLLDACWGAGAIGDDRKYHAGFSAHEFTHSNEEFGRTHFPQDRKHLYRADGRVLTWAEYILGDTQGQPVTVYSDVAPKEGISKFDFEPKQKYISLDPAAHAATGGMIRFQFRRRCDHWRPGENGAPKDFLYAVSLSDGKWEAFQTNGTYWWHDIHISRLGKRGEKFNIWNMKVTNGGVSARGVPPADLMKEIQRGGTSFGGLAHWELV